MYDSKQAEDKDITGGHTEQREPKSAASSCRDITPSQPKSTRRRKWALAQMIGEDSIDQGDPDFAVDKDTERGIKKSVALRTSTAKEHSPVCSERPRRRATRKTYLHNGDFLLFNDDTGVDDPFDSSFEEHKAMQMSDDGHEHANTRSSSSRSRRRPHRRPRDEDDADYHLQDLDNLSDDETKSLKVLSQKKDDLSDQPQALDKYF